MNVGLSITILGMAIVFAFIGLLAVCIDLLERFRSDDLLPAPTDTAETLPTTAIIAAAIHAHRSKMKRM
jgi:Na+-transporting methylmalonyl-CoA/oxaloacetate decarboxylase gamma subunit